MTENRQTFMDRLKPFYSPSALLDVQVAYMLAKHEHRAQVRQERDDQGNQVRYFEHLRRVSLILIDEVHITERDLVIAALLHDSLEDTRDLTAEMIEHLFGRDVVSIVKVLSKIPKEGYPERLRTSTDWRAYVIKACDRLDNLRSLSQASKEFQLKQLRETQEKYVPLFDRMIDLTPRQYVTDVIELRRRVTNELYTKLQHLSP